MIERTVFPLDFVPIFLATASLMTGRTIQGFLFPPDNFHHALNRYPIGSEHLTIARSVIKSQVF